MLMSAPSGQSGVLRAVTTLWGATHAAAILDTPSTAMGSLVMVRRISILTCTYNTSLLVYSATSLLVYSATNLQCY